MKLKTRNNIVKVYRNLVPGVLKSKVRELYFNSEWIYNKIKWLFLYGITDYFNGVAIEISSYCQLRCSICPNLTYDRGLKKNKVKMGLDVIEKILNDLKGFKGTIEYHRFNEPLTDERLDTIIRLTKKLLPKCRVFIASNGLLLTEKRYNNLIYKSTLNSGK